MDSPREHRTGFVALMRTPDAEDLLRDHAAFALMSVIALRARYTRGPHADGLERGQAWIGDWKATGFSSEKRYRSAKKLLEKLGFVAFKGAKTGANRGTVASVLDSRVFDVFFPDRGEQTGEQRGERGANEGRTRGDKQQGNTENKETKQRGAGAPTLSQVLSFASEIGHPADDATRYFQNREGKGWHNITDWQADFRAWAARYRPPAAPAPASVNRFDPDFVAPEVVAAQQNRRNVKTAIIAAAIAAGRRLSPTEYRNLLCDDGALAAIPADDRQSGIEAAINSTEWRALPPPTATPGKAGPMAATLTRLAQKAGVG